MGIFLFVVAKMVEAMSPTKIELKASPAIEDLKMTPTKTVHSIATPTSLRQTPTKRADAGPYTPRRSERIQSKTPGKKVE